MKGHGDMMGYPKKLSEHEECVILCEWMDMNWLTYIHVTNENKRSPREGAKLNKIGRMKGFPDYLIFDTPQKLWYDEHPYKGVVIEMKAKGGKYTKEQKRWLDVLREEGWYIVDGRKGAHYAIEQLERIY